MKITFMGAGSTVFAKNVLGDVLLTPALNQNLEIALYDIDGDRLAESKLVIDALNNKYCDMVESGIIDPTKVTRSVLQNAASVASTLLTTESIVTDIPTPPAPMAPGGDMGGMY